MERFSYIGYYASMAFAGLVVVALAGGAFSAGYLIYLVLTN